MPMTEEQYEKCAEFFYYFKIIHGNDFLNSTLRRHKQLYLALLEYEKKHIIDLESDLLIGE